MHSYKYKARHCLWFDHGGYAAAEFYVGLLPDSEIDAVYAHGNPADPMVVEFTLARMPMMILTAQGAPPSSNASSISVLTKDQTETDHLWAELTAYGGEAGRCGWLKDRFGTAWQIVPEEMPRLLGDPDPARSARAFAAMMKMQKIDIAAIRSAADGA